MRLQNLSGLQPYSTLMQLQCLMKSNNSLLTCIHHTASCICSRVSHFRLFSSSSSWWQELPSLNSLQPSVVAYINRIIYKKLDNRLIVCLLFVKLRWKALNSSIKTIRTCNAFNFSVFSFDSSFNVVSFV